MLWLLVIDTVLVAVTKDAPVALSEGVELTLLGDDRRVAQAHAQFLDIKLVKLRDSLGHSLRHRKVGCD